MKDRSYTINDKDIDKFLKQVIHEQLTHTDKIAQHVNDTYDHIRMKYLYY